MALFYLLAKSGIGDFEWGQVHSKMDTYRHNCITIFPISKQFDLPNNAIGITASSKWETQMPLVRQELTELLEFFWNAHFAVFDLYKGSLVTKSNYDEVMDYL